MSDNQDNNTSNNKIANIDDPVFNRGCYRCDDCNVSQNMLDHSASKMDQFNWMRDFESNPSESSPCIAEVRFKNDRKDYFTYPPELELQEGDMVAVETAIGHDIGIVTLTGDIVLRQIKRKKYRTPMEEMKKIYRRARTSDIEKWLAAIKMENSTLFRSRQIADNLGLDMKLNDIEYQGDKTKAVFYYTADGRVDFRELIKKLAEEFHVRVEMRQIGVRQESAKLGGIGSCGRELCCASWICNFQSVTTNVAHVQQLSPNPQKLAGQCGKLKCCLNFEYEAYCDALKEFPDSGIVLKFKSGDAIHQKNDVFQGIMWYSYANDRSNIMAIPLNKVKEIISANKKGQKPERLEDYVLTMEQHTNTEETFLNDDGSEVDLRKYE